MPAQDAYDPADIAARLETWLASREPDASDVKVVDIDAPSGNGFSSETVMFTAAWKRGGTEESHELVLRTKPTGHTVFPFYDMGLQFDIISKVGASGAVPVPPLRYHESDDSAIGREFFVMERVDGMVPPDNLPYTMDGWLLESSPEQQRELQKSSLDAIAALHALDWRSMGLHALDMEEYGPVGLRQQLGFYDFFLDWGRQGSDQPVIEAARNWLVENVPDPEPEPVLNWGDARIGNILYRDFRPSAVLDWEMANLGPRELDLSWFCLFQRFFSEFLGVEDLPGFVSQEEVVAQYEELTGYQVGDLGWYLVFGAYRYAVIMMRIILGEREVGGGMFTLEDNVAIGMLNGIMAQYAD